MSPTSAPRISRVPRVSPVWIVPVVALLVAVWMIYREWGDRGPEITIEFAEGSGVAAGQTKLEYKGVAVGLVSGVALAPELSGVVVTVRLQKHAAGLARTGAQFWIVQPEIRLSGVSGLDTLVSGVRITLRPGEGAPAKRFRGLDEAPAQANSESGRAFHLLADQLGVLQPGSPVYYRGVKVGEVETSRLADDAARVLIRIRVSTPYVNLVRANTRFWAAGGFPVSISLFGKSLETHTLEALIAGAVAFATPDELAEVATADTQFQLHDDSEREWLDWRPRIPITPREEAPGKTPRANDASPRSRP